MRINKLQYSHGITCVTEKKCIVIHGTASGSMEDAKAAFQKNGVSVPFIIDRDGTIYQLYDEKFLHWHAGSNFREISKKSIGIEMVCWNHVKYKKDHAETWTGEKIPISECKSLQYRGENLFNIITKEQHKALEELLSFLCGKYHIQKRLVRDFNPKLIKDENFSGICFHSSFHPHKMDFPPNLIDPIYI